jgi:carboxyl-terminal processing protease
VGYISLNPVAETSADELQSEITSMKSKGMKSLILDLRLNPGGLLDQGVKVADLFLDQKQEIVATRGRARGSTKEFYDEAKQQWPELPIVVLVNDGTASAAEIIAGALQDHDRALVVGDTTYGKGIVQTLFPLGPEVALRITTARWFTPSGRSIQGASLDSVMGAEHLAAGGTFHTDGGRRLPGGGGIVPDVQLGPDTLTTAEQGFGRALAGQLAAFRDAVNATAIELRGAGSVRAETFLVDQPMRDALRRQLESRGIRLADSTFRNGERILSQQLAYEVARYQFGAAAERRRRVSDDPQIGEAAALLRQAGTAKALLGLATGPTAPSNH